MGIFISKRGRQEHLLQIKSSQLKRNDKGRRKHETNRRNRTRQNVPTPSTSQSHYADIDDGYGCAGREFPPITADDDYYYMNKDDTHNTCDKATCTTTEETFGHLLQHNDGREFIRPRRDSTSDSAFSDKGSRISNKSLEDDFSTTNETENRTNLENGGSKSVTMAKRCDSQEAAIQQMVEAFRPIIVEIIRVTEVLPYLLFLDDTEVILARELYSPKGAAALLLDQLKHSEETGKWTTFLNALKIAGYMYLVNMLLGDSTHDTSDHKNILKIFTPEIISNLLPSHLIQHLFAKDVLSQTDKEEIECTLRYRGTTAASLMLLDRIPRRHSNWYHEFILALKECDFRFLAEKLDRHESEFYLTPTASEKPKSSAEPPPPVPRRARQPLRVSSRVPLESRRQSTSIPPKCHTFREVHYMELYQEKKQLIIQLMDLKEEKRLQKDIRKLQIEYDNALMADDSEDVHTDSHDSSCDKNTPTSTMLTSTIADITDTSSNPDTDANQSTNDDSFEISRQTNQTVTATAPDCTGTPTTFQAAIYCTGEERPNQIPDEIKNEILENVKTHISAEISKALQQTIPATCPFNRAMMYRSFKDLSHKINYTAQVPLANTCRNNTSFDSGMGMLPDSDM